VSDQTSGPLTTDEVLGSRAHAVIATDVAGVIVYWNAIAETLYGWTSEEAVGRTVPELTVPAVELGGALPGFLDRSTDAAVVLSREAVVTYATPAVRDVFGWEAIVGTSVVPLLHPDERVDLARYIEMIVAHPGAHQPFEGRVSTEEGWVWAEVAMTNLLDDRQVRGVVCSLRRSLRRDSLESALLEVRQLHEALRSRVVIEQAKGFLAARHSWDPEDAFLRLRSFSRNNHLVIHEVARRVLSGSLDLSAT
jgi:PAS domain S-box-containing protein